MRFRAQKSHYKLAYFELEKTQLLDKFSALNRSHTYKVSRKQNKHFHAVYT